MNLVLQIVALAIFSLVASVSPLPLVPSSSILFYFASSQLSHRLAALPLARSLSAKGHNVTFISSFPGTGTADGDDIQEISVSEILGDARQAYRHKSPWELRLGNEQHILWDIAPVNAALQCELILNHPKIHEWVKRASYDLIILDSPHECGLAFVGIFHSKLILFSGSPLFMGIPDSYGFSPESSWIPDLQRGFPTHPEISYLQRFSNELRSIRWHLFNQVYLFSQVQKMFDKVKANFKNLEISTDNFDLREVEKTTSLILTNSHFSDEYARSLPPFVVSVGGIHIEKYPQDLPNKLTEFIGNAPFFYVSFGTALSISEMPEVTKNALFGALKSSGYRFIVKSNSRKDILGDNESKSKESFYVADWLPQQAILAHPKIQGFLTSGSSLSIQEAVYYAVPIITIPVMLDQICNAQRVQRLGSGSTLDISNLDETSIHNSLYNLVHNDTIKKSMKATSTKFRDRPTEPLELSVWWVEYVLRHDPTFLQSLKPLGIHQTWAQRRQLDVWFPLFIIALLAISSALYVFYLTIRTLFATISEHFYPDASIDKDK